MPVERCVYTRMAVAEDSKLEGRLRAVALAVHPKVRVGVVVVEEDAAAQGVTIYYDLAVEGTRAHVSLGKKAWVCLGRSRAATLELLEKAVAQSIREDGARLVRDAKL